MWFAAALFFLAEYFARVAPAVMGPDLMHAFHVKAFALGSLSACFYYAYILMQLPVGVLVDLLNTRIILTIMACVCGLTNIFLSLTSSIIIADFARFIMGLSAAFAFVGALKIAYMWFPKKKIGVLSGATQALGMVGAAVGQGPVAWLITKIGWQYSLQLIGGILIALSFLLYLIVQPSKIIIVNKQKHLFIEYWSKTILALKQILHHRMLWLNGLLIGCLYAPTAAFAELWGTTYLHRVHHLSYVASANALSCVFIGLALGCPLAGWFSDKLQKRKPILFLSVVISGLLLSYILFGYSGRYAVLCFLLFLYGLSNAGIAVSYAYAADISAPSIVGTSIGFTNMAAVIIGALLQPVIGLILDFFSDSSHTLNVASNGALTAYKLAMLPLLTCLLIAFFTCFFLKETIYNKT